jgi:hypothetical protein
MRVKAFFAIFLVNLTLCSCRSSGTMDSELANPDAVLDEDKSIAKSLFDETKSAVLRETLRDFHVYHWAPRQNISGTSASGIVPSDEQVFNYMNWLINEFWTKPKSSSGSAVGYGLYASFDPFTTKDYGQGDGVLLQLIIPSGTRFIDISGSASSYRLSPGLVTRLTSANCGRGVAELLNSTADRCGKIFKEFMHHSRAYTVKYNFGSLNGVNLCRDFRSVAIVIKGKDVVAPGRTVAFGRKAFPQTNEHYTNQVLLNKVGQLLMTGTSFWPELSSAQLPSQLDPQKWAQDNLWACHGVDGVRPL